MRIVATPSGLLIEPCPKKFREIPYSTCVRTARKYLRLRDFLHYGSQLIPERIESETWSMAWAYIREVDDIVDRPNVDAAAILRSEWEKVEEALAGGVACREGKGLLRHAWLDRFFENLFEYYDSREVNRVLETIRKLYESALMDAYRRGRLLSRREMMKLICYKAVAFFDLYFTLARFRMGAYAPKLAELLGVGLGMLDDILDAFYDLESGYINLTREDLEELQALAHPNDQEMIKKLLANRRFLRAKALYILKVLLRARSIAWKLRDPLARNLVLRLTEVFAAPILEGRFVPGAKYFFKGGRILLKLLPSDEMLAYEIGHKLVKKLLSIPQLTPALIKLWIRLVEEPGKQR